MKCSTISSTRGQQGLQKALSTQKSDRLQQSPEQLRKALAEQMNTDLGKSENCNGKFCLLPNGKSRRIYNISVGDSFQQHQTIFEHRKSELRSAWCSPLRRWFTYLGWCPNCHSHIKKTTDNLDTTPKHPQKKRGSEKVDVTKERPHKQHDHPTRGATTMRVSPRRPRLRKKTTGKQSQPETRTLKFKPKANNDHQRPRKNQTTTTSQCGKHNGDHSDYITQTKNSNKSRGRTLGRRTDWFTTNDSTFVNLLFPNKSPDK